MKLLRKLQKSISKRIQRYKANKKAPHFPKQIICCQGFYCSGSSALTGLFMETDNVSVIGYSEPIFSKCKVKDECGETLFFMGSQFHQLIKEFYTGSPTSKDYYIKYFINAINRANSKHHGTDIYERMPTLYNEYFKKIAEDFLFSVIKLDDYTKRLMKNRQFPVLFESASDKQYEGCTFMKNKGIRQYLFYEFADLTNDQFAEAVSKFLKGFLSIMGDKDIVSYDQLLPDDSLEIVNQYLQDTPIKQICVWRDPRDQFMSVMRTDLLLLKRDVKSYCDYYLSGQCYHYNLGLEYMLTHPNPNRLMVRFEDLVFKYEETVQKIFNFVGIDRKHHCHKNDYFTPAISMQNIGSYKYFIDQEFMKQVESRLSKYCYYPESEPSTTN